MNTPHDHDQLFDENLLSLGTSIGEPDRLTEEARTRCAAAFHHPQVGVGLRTMRFVRKPAFLSTVGVAAAIALIFGFLYHPAGNASVDAAVILAKLDDQIRQSSLIDIVIDSVDVNQAFVNGRIQICKSGAAGDIQVKVVQKADEPPIDVDAAFGLSPDNGWVLLRKLHIPDPQIAPMLNFFLPPGGTTLVILPTDEMDFNEFDMDDLGSGAFSQIITELIESASDVGATVVSQPDGNILLTLPIKDEGTIKALSRLKSFAGKDTVQVGIGASEKQRPRLDIQIVNDENEGDGKSDDENEEYDTSGLEELYGITLKILYDPHMEVVRSIVIENIGSANGRVSITIGEGEIDPALLDSARVTDENTRVLDIKTLQYLFGSSEKSEKAADE